MTWLDNFYHGKGALVVYTSEGVKTWLLRFPGDTMNVFSWEKGSSNIKTGDFNGDGITDYVDENSNIYEGIKNGEPPKPEAISQAEALNPWFVGDFNGDGYDDVADGTNALGIKPMLVMYGKPSLKDIKAEPIMIPQIDSNNIPITAYMFGAKEMRIVCGHTYWTNSVKYPFRHVYKDGLRLVRVWWEGNGFKSEILDEFTVDLSKGLGGLNSGGVLLRNSEKRIYWLGATDADKLNVYNLSADKLEKLYTKKYNDGVIMTLNHSIDGDSIPDFYIRGQRADGMREIIFYSGTIDKDIQPLYQFATVQISTLISLDDVTGDLKPDFALSNDYIVSGREKYRFSILSIQDSASSVVEEREEGTTFSIKTISPMPVSKDKIVNIKVTVPQEGSYTACFYDSTGKRIPGKSYNYQLSGNEIITLNIVDYAVSSGTYSLRLEGNGKIAQCTIVIQ